MLLAALVLPSLHAACSQPVARTPSRVALTTAGAEGPARNGATFVAQVTSAAEAESASAPTGSVSFMDGERSVGAALLDAQGRATLKVAALPPGDHAITAVYQGDGAFEAAASAPAVVTAEATGVPGFTLAASNSSLSVVAGNTVSTVITATPQNGFNQAVSLSCSGVPYTTVDCVFVPAQITPGAPTAANPNGTAAISTLSIQTTAYSGGELRQPGFPRPGGSGTVYAVLAPGILALAGVGFTRRRKGKSSGAAKSFAVLFLLAASGMGLSSCSQRYNYFHRPPEGNPGTPAGTYTVVISGITGTGSSLSTATVQVTLVVTSS